MGTINWNGTWDLGGLSIGVVKPSFKFLEIFLRNGIVSCFFFELQLCSFMENPQFEATNEGLVQMSFLFQQVIFRFHVNFSRVYLPGTEHWSNGKRKIIIFKSAGW